MDEILEYLKANPTYYYATVDENGDPQIRPFGTIAKIGDALYIQTGNTKACWRQAKAHPRGAICTMGKDGTWIRIEADFIDCPEPELSEAMLDEYPHLRAMYTPGENATVLRLDNIHATISSFTDAPREIEI